MNAAETVNVDSDTYAVLAAWAEEAESRLDGILAGERKTIPGDEVARRVRENIAQ